GHLVPGERRAIEALHLLDREGNQLPGADGRAIDPLQPVTLAGEENHYLVSVFCGAAWEVGAGEAAERVFADSTCRTMNLPAFLEPRSISAVTRTGSRTSRPLQADQTS